MNVLPRSAVNDSKHWLLVLTAAATVSIAYVTFSFVKTLSPSEPSVVAPQKPAPAPAEEPVTRTEPDWNAAQAVQVPQAPTTRVDPFAAQYAAAAKAAAANDPVVRQQEVHRQAEYLRNLISQGKPTAGYGNLTKEQVDEMEQKGITIE